MAENKQEQAARAMHAEDQKALEESRKQYHERMKGKPTPTQEECDLIKLGAPMVHKEDSGAGPGVMTLGRQRSMEARPGGAGGYATRRAQPSQPQSGQPPRQS